MIMKRIRLSSKAAKSGFYEKDPEMKMVDAEERPKADALPKRRSTPAAGCFGYLRPSAKPLQCGKVDPSIFAALFNKQV
jgi:hypothetical protein